jgi:hypothetical protein
MPTYTFVDSSGSQQEVNAEIDIYRAAAEANLSLSQYLDREYPADRERGSTFEQFMMSAGMFLNHDRGLGINPPTMADVLNGTTKISMGSIVRNDGAQRHTPSGRLLFPEIILQNIAATLYGDEGRGFIAGFNSAIATTQNVNSPLVDQPVISTAAPRAVSSQPVAQLAEPPSMVTITTSEKAYRIPTHSIGLAISEQAERAASLDLVNLSMNAQALSQLKADYLGYLSAIINGDTDVDPSATSALTAVTAQSLDATNDATGDLSHLAWIQWLYSEDDVISISHVFADVIRAITIETRTGRPVVTTDRNTDGRINVEMTTNNLNLSPPRLVITPTATIGANMILGVDSRYAMRKLINVAASYEGIENFVMRRSRALRADYGVSVHRLQSQALKLLSLVAT